MMAGTKLWLAAVVFISVTWQGICDESELRIKAKHGILYQDGKPCFLVGVCSDAGYDGFSVHSASPATLDMVPGREGNGLKISFPAIEKRTGSRWIDFPGFDPRLCVEQKAKFLKLWVKGDGSTNVINFVVEGYLGKTSFSLCLGEFSLADTNWKQFAFPLEGKYEKLAQANSCYLALPYNKVTREGFSYVLDDITIEGPAGETVIGDFDRKMPVNNIGWSKLAERARFKDDPVYKALWNDPLYQEISGKNFQIIGMNTLHLATVEHFSVAALITSADNAGGGCTGDGYLCEKLNGMPMVPGFIFTFGAYNGGKGAEDWARNAGLPPTVLQRNPNGSPLGGYMALCPEDPVGNRMFKEKWQQGARSLLKIGANIYAYELINENTGYYRCGCQKNKEMFISRLKEKYKDIETLNKDWGSKYQSFEEIREQIPKLGGGEQKIKGLTVAWNKFLEDRYVEVMQQGGAWIHEVEDELKKPHALMSQMGYPSWDFLGYGGADLFKMAKGLDMIQTEAGVYFGSGVYSGEVNPLTLVMASKGAYGHQMCLDLADCVCPDKPIINLEHYLARHKGSIEPISKADIITSLWEEFIRGASAVHTFWWGVLYASREEALADGENRRLLCPYVYPRESLNGYKEVQEEIGRVADIVMKRPRLGREAEIGVLFSRPTARYLVGKPGYVKDWKKETPFYRSHETVYTYLLENHYPRRYVYEEQLPEGKAENYRVLLVPHSDNIYPDTMKYLEKHVNNGGTLICFGDAFRYDEYGNEKEKGRSYLLGLERIKTNSFTEEVEIKDFGKVKVTTERAIIPSTAQMIITFPRNKKPFITLNKVGKGSVYYVNADTFNLDGSLIDPLLDYLCQKANLNPPVIVCDPDGNKEPMVEAELIPGGRKGTVLFLVNWKPYQDRAVRLSLPGLDEREKYYLADIAKDHLYTKDGKETVTGTELREGIYLLLPAEERVVLLLTGKKYSAANKPVELLSASAARELNEKNSARLKAEHEKEVAEASKRKEIVFCVIDGSLDQIMECLKSAAGDAVEGITLKSSINNCSVVGYGLREGKDSILTYLLVFKGTAKDDEKDQVLTKVLNVLLNKYGNKLKIISGWKEADILKARETGACLPLDLRKQANMGFTDEKADDQKGGLFDEGRSLKGLPVGSNTFAGIVFDVIDPEKNNGLACIVLRGKAKPFFPEKAEGITVGRKTKNIYLLHGACYCARDSQVVYRLKFNYADNTDAYTDIKAGSEIADWFGKGFASDRPAWTGKAIEKTGDAGKGKEWDVSFYCARIANPNPEKEIRTLDFISANNTAAPAIFAVTVENN